MVLQLPSSCRTPAPRFYILALAVACALWLLVATYRSYFLGNSIPIVQHVQRQQLVIRTTPTNQAGIGSVLGQLRSSVAIATMLGAQFATYGLQSEHPYRVASLLHIDILDGPMDRLIGGRVCALSALPDHERIPDLVESWCNDPKRDENTDTRAQELRRLLKECDLILDDRPWDVRQEMAKCTWKWVKGVFSKLARDIDLPKRAGGIGIHIRWGDMASGGDSSDPKTPERSIPIEVAAKLLHKLRICDVQDELSIYMEAHNTTLLDGLGERTSYRLVDSGNDIADLLDLASNRVMVLDIGSYTAIAHQISDGGVTVVPDIDGFGISWHGVAKNSVLRWQELLAIECDDLLRLLG